MMRGFPAGRELWRSESLAAGGDEGQCWGDGGDGKLSLQKRESVAGVRCCCL